MEPEWLTFTIYKEQFHFEITTCEPCSIILYALDDIHITSILLSAASGTFQGGKLDLILTQCFQKPGA